MGDGTEWLTIGLVAIVLVVMVALVRFIIGTSKIIKQLHRIIRPLETIPQQEQR